MRIIKMAPDEARPGSGRAVFDVDIDGVAVFGLALRKNRAGTWRVYPPAPAAIIRFAPDLMDRIGELAGAAYDNGGHSPDEHHNAAG